METREHNTSRTALTELARIAYRRGEASHTLREEKRHERQAELAKEREESRKARELQEARRIRKDKVVAAVETSRASTLGSQGWKAPSGV